MRAVRSRLTRRLLAQYILALLLLGVGIVLAVVLSYLMARSVTWQTGDPLYSLLRFCADYLLLFMGGTFLLGWAVITYVFISRPLRYLDGIVTAAQSLAEPGEAPIRLPAPLKEVQDQLNLFREQAMRNAAAARSAEQRKNDLIIYLAHDLKTPLTSVIGYLTLLRDEPDISPALRARYTGIALDKAMRLEELINEFFDITRFNLTTLTLAPERVSFTRMLEQTVSEFLPVLEEKGLTWDERIQPGVEILCDRDKLERVLDNLIRNAVNYSDPGTPICLSMTAADGRAEVTVRNRGRTIPPEKLEHIFEQFFRVDESRGTATGGAGLGLAIAKEIVELHGGTIRAASAGGEIAFTVELPLDGQKIV